ncbi:hypothetical protein AFCDBAGC_5008 [Methylobacterium cerastii]|uniref:Uncharacterized protein n=1 Tax=Methylobacterium cerastii TaxID=932741 RepID=A0ABQ4QPB4_9HYPH|nr:hypothetical protein [Methylobacterium cerastii]GJD47123.1 hypothetical protein AFCDBAGC_5008 [Methylobacterium cerastii]
MGDLLTFKPRRHAAPLPDTRTRIEGALALALDAVDQLVAALDDIDADPDLEDGSDTEPSLAAPEGHDCQVVWLRGTDRDLEMG